jgi:tRNA threonylcarbamoyladenosine biosynthesis protein TsaE
MTQLTYIAKDESATAALGAALAELLPDGAVVALLGELGAGKTRLVQAVAEALGIERRDVTSPTFVLVQQHRGQRTLNHIDAYRLRDEDEFREAGADECFDGEGLTLIEWADRVPDCLPPERLEVRIECVSETARRFEIAAFGVRYERVIEQLADRGLALPESRI